MRHFLITFSYLVLVSLTACSQQASTKKTESTAQALELLGAKDFDARMKAEPGVLIDVRTASEQQKGIIPGAIAMDIFADNFEAQIDKLDKNKTYYVYCAAGGRSAEASEMMNKKGFVKVVDLDGGFKSWQSQALPTAMP